MMHVHVHKIFLEKKICIFNLNIFSLLTLLESLRNHLIYKVTVASSMYWLYSGYVFYFFYASVFINCSHIRLHLILRYEDLQDVLVHDNTEASVLTLHRETLSASSCSASTVQPFSQPALLSPVRPPNQRIHHCNHVWRDIKYSFIQHIYALMEILCFHISFSGRPNITFSST